MGSSSKTPSPQLAAANQRLMALRAQNHPGSQEKFLSEKSVCPWDQALDGSPSPGNTSLSNLPTHLGWGSAALTAVLRRQARAEDGDEENSGWITEQREMPKASSLQGAAGDPELSTPGWERTPSGQLSLTKSWVKLYPDIGLGMLREEQTAPGRLWLMLRFLDRAGTGVVRIDITQQELTKKSSTLRLCGKRQLRNLLQAGDGTFWTRDKAHIWLRSAARVAHALGVPHLSGRPVAFPLKAMVNGIGDFRAHLYAAFHSGRVKDTPEGTQTMPIARDTMTAVSGVGRSSQIDYEARAGIRKQANFAVGEQLSKEAQEERAWSQGQALFELRDYRGEQGKQGRTYLAWQLPNTYEGQHQHRPKGRQKRINRKLKDLVMQGMPGNVDGANGTLKSGKIYFPNGKLAAKAHGRDPEADRYWRRHGAGDGRFTVWQQL